MQKAPFSGITALDPNESLYTDNSAFVQRDRFEIDRELKLGVKTHRHNGLAGLANPVSAPSGLVIGSGGSIPAGLSLTLGVTYQDPDGGETLVGPTTLVTTPSPVQAPTTQLAAAIEYTAGILDVDTFTYAFTYVDGSGGETPLGPPTVVVRSPGFANARVKLSGQAPGGEFPDAAIVAARIYRARAGGEFVFLAEVGTGTFTDDGSVSPDCDRHPPNFNLNSTGGANQIEVTLPPNPPTGSGNVERAFINLYCSQSGTFDESCLVGRYPTGSAGASLFVTSLDLLDAQPPDVNRSFGGAAQIDPDTELLDWHWKRPVANEGALPEDAEAGDARVALDTGTIWVYDGVIWKEAVGAGGSGKEYTDTFPAGLLDADWHFLLGEFPLVETEALEAKAEGLVGTAPEGGQLGRTEEASAGSVEIDYVLDTAETGLNYQVGVVGKWIDRENYLIAWRFEGSPYMEILGKWENQEVINVFLRKEEHPEVPGQPASGEKVTMRLTYNDELLQFDWVASAGNFEMKRTVAELIEEQPTHEAGILALLAAVGMPGLLLQPEGIGEEIRVTRFRFVESLGGAVAGHISVTDGTTNVSKVEELEVKGKEGVKAEVTEPSSGKALVTVSAPGAMGVVWCGEDLTKARPSGFDSVTWITQGKGEEEPEHMAVHDLLYALP